MFPFDKAIFNKAAIITLFIWIAVLVLIQVYQEGGILPPDVIGSTISAAILAYLIHLIILFERDTPKKED